MSVHRLPVKPKEITGFQAAVQDIMCIDAPPPDGFAIFCWYDTGNVIQAFGPDSKRALWWVKQYVDAVFEKEDDGA